MRVSNTKELIILTNFTRQLVTVLSVSQSVQKEFAWKIQFVNFMLTAVVECARMGGNAGS